MKAWLQSLVWWFCLMGIGVATSSAAPPSSVYPDDSDAAETQLRAAAANVGDRQWSEAADLYRDILKSYGTKSIRMADKDRQEMPFIEETRRWVNLREHVLCLLAQWPKEGRDAYRQKADVQAATLWNQATAVDSEPNQAAADLKRLAFDFYLSSYGDKAMERLGDIAFQNGEFREAASWYERLVGRPDAPQPEPGSMRMPPAYPALSSDPALVTAKLILALHGIGNLTEAERQSLMKAFAAKFPASQGLFAGRTGLFLTSLSKAISDDKLTETLEVDPDWPTFAGAPSRNRVVEDAIGLGARQWRMPLEIVTPGRINPQANNRFGGFGGFGGGRGMARGIPTNPNRNNPAPILAYHPIILGDQIIVGTERRITAYNLNESAKPDGTVGILWRQEFESAGVRPNQLMSSAPARMTLTAKNGRIFARMGQTGVTMDFGNRVGPSNAFLVALDARNKGQILWRVQGTQIKLLQPNGVEAPALGSIEGTPVADDTCVYFVITVPGHQTSNYVAALSAETGEVQWVQYLFDAPNPFDLQAAMMGYQANHAHHLLTLADDRLFFQSDSGGVACLDRKTGSLQWLTAYPKREVLAVQSSIPTSRRELNPVIFSDGMIYVAPEDSAHLFALDANTGEMRWKSAPLPDVVHLVGVSKGHLFATGDRVWTIQASTGKIVRSWPDTGSGYEASGRGLLAGNYLYWPTANEIHILDQTTGLRSERGSIRLRERFQTSGGNLVIGDGFLAVAGTDNLSIFTQNTRLIRRYQQLIAASPDSAVPRYRLATVAESLNETQMAIDALRAATEKVKPSDTLDGQSLEKLITDRLYRLLTNQAAQTKDRALALALLTEASNKSSDPVKKRAAIVLRAGVLIETNQSARAFGELADVARDPISYHGLWSVENRYEVNLSEQARRAMSAAWSKLKEPEKAEIWARERGDLESRLTKPLTSEFVEFLAGLSAGPAAAKGWLEWSERLIKANDPAWFAALSKAQEMPLAAPEVQARIRSLLDLSATEPRKKPVWPVTRWSSSNQDFQRVLVVTDQSGSARRAGDPGSHSLLLGISKNGSSRVMDPMSGSAAPDPLPGIGTPQWAGVVSGRGLIFDGSVLTGLNLAGGGVHWRVALNRGDIEDSQNSPFAKPKAIDPNETVQAEKVQPETSNPDSKPVGWWTIHARDGRLMVHNQLGDSWRINPFDGRVLWHRLAESPGVPSAFMVGRHVIMRDGSTVLILDSESGAMTRSMDTGIAGTDWSREPMQWDADRVILTPDRLNVAMIDLAKGQRVWTWQATPVQPHNGTPRYFRSGQTLVVIADGETAARLDPNTGQVSWQMPLGSADHSREDRDIAIDEKRLYINESMESTSVPGVSVRALSLTDGSLAWKATVIGPGTSWAVAVGMEGAQVDGEGSVWVYPDESRNRRIASGLVQDDDFSDTTGILSQANSGSPAVALLDPSTGRIKQRFVSQMAENQAVWAVPDQFSGRIFWGQARSSRVAMVEIGEFGKKNGR